MPQLGAVDGEARESLGWTPAPPGWGHPCSPPLCPQHTSVPICAFLSAPRAPCAQVGGSGEGSRPRTPWEREPGQPQLRARLGHRGAAHSAPRATGRPRTSAGTRQGQINSRHLLGRTEERMNTPQARAGGPLLTWQRGAGPRPLELQVPRRAPPGRRLRAGPRSSSCHRPGHTPHGLNRVTPDFQVEVLTPNGMEFGSG